MSQFPLSIRHPSDLLRDLDCMIVANAFTPAATLRSTRIDSIAVAKFHLEGRNRMKNGNLNFHLYLRNQLGHDNVTI